MLGGANLVPKSSAEKGKLLGLDEPVNRQWRCARVGQDLASNLVVLEWNAKVVRGQKGAAKSDSASLAGKLERAMVR